MFERKKKSVNLKEMFMTWIHFIQAGVIKDLDPYQNEIKHPVINVLPLVWFKNLSFLCSIISGFSISAYDTHTP